MEQTYDRARAARHPTVGSTDHTTHDRRKGTAVSHLGEPVGTGRLTTLARRHPVATFVVAALTLTTAVQIPPVLAGYGVIPGRTLPSRLGLDMEEAASILVVLALVAVTLAVTALEGGRPAVTTLLRRATRWRAAPGWWFAAAAALPLGTIGLAVALGDTARVPTAAALGAELVSAGIALCCINLWEETAWAGFLQTRLERTHTLVVAAVLTAVPFSAVHLPLRVVSGEITTPGGLAAGFLGLMVLTPVIRVLFGGLLRGGRGSILLVAVAHTAFNRSNNTDGIAADVLTGDARQLAALLTTAALTVVVVVVLRRFPRATGRHEVPPRRSVPTEEPTADVS